MTIPLNTKIGSTAYLHGLAYMDTVQVEDLKHFAQDAGKSEAEIEKMIQWGTPYDLEIYKGWSNYFSNITDEWI